MKVKDGVDIKYLKEEIKNNLWKIEMACKIVNGINYEMTITSGRDGIHSKNSLHYENLAIDIRRRDMLNSVLTARIIGIGLGRNYDVVLEETHIHIEYDPK